MLKKKAKKIIIYLSQKGGISMLQKLAKFMMGRYGSDHLNTVLLVSALVLSLVLSLFSYSILLLIPYALMGYALFRTFSKNINARRKEYYTFLKFYTPFMQWFKLKKQIFSQRKMYKYFKCPNCKQQLRAPKGRGKIKVVCQKCHKEFEKKV